MEEQTGQTDTPTNSGGRTTFLPIRPTLFRLKDGVDKGLFKFEKCQVIFIVVEGNWMEGVILFDELGFHYINSISEPSYQNFYDLFTPDLPKELRPDTHEWKWEFCHNYGATSDQTKWYEASIYMTEEEAKEKYKESEFVKEFRKIESTIRRRQS